MDQTAEIVGQKFGHKLHAIHTILQTAELTVITKYLYTEKFDETQQQRLDPLNTQK